MQRNYGKKNQLSTGNHDVLEKKIYDLFNNDIFLENVTFIVRNFLITTWLMESENHIRELQSKALIIPTVKLIKKSLGNILSLENNEIYSITRSILNPFLDRKSNNKLYESIINKWWSTYAGVDPGIFGEAGYNAKASACAKRTFAITRDSIALLTNLSAREKAEFLFKELNKKFDTLHEMTDRFPRSRRLLHLNTRTTFLEYFSLAMLVSIPLSLLVGFTIETFFKIFITTALIVFAMEQIKTHLLRSRTERKLGLENTLLTDYFITDKILKSIQLLAEKKQHNESSAENKIEVVRKSKNTLVEYAKSETEIFLFDISTQDGVTKKFSEYAKIQQNLNKKQKENKRKIILQLPPDSNIHSITWKGNNSVYIYKPLASKSVVVSLWSEDQYLKPFCKNNFIFCDKAGLRKLIPNKTQRSEHKSILRNGKVVKAENCRGLVRVMENDILYLKTKDIGTGSSHYRLFCEPKLNTVVKEDNKEVTKTLYVPVKFRND